MSVRKRRELYAKVQAFKSICKSIEGYDPLASLKIPNKLRSIVKNGEDILPYLIDIMIALKGSAFIKDALKETLETFIPQMELEARKLLKIQYLQSLVSSQKVSDTDCLVNGLYIPLNMVDMFLRLKGNGRKYDDFELKLKQAIVGGDKMTLDGVISIEYISSTNELLVRAVPEVLDKKVGDVMDSLGEGFQLDSDTIIDELLDILFNIFPFLKDKTNRRKVLEKAINSLEPSEASFTRFDFDSALGNIEVVGGYISSLDCDGNIVVLSEDDIDELYNSEDFVETVYELLIGNGSIPTESQSAQLGKNLFRALLLAIVDKLILSPSSIFRYLVFLNLDGGCKLDPKYSNFLNYLNKSLKNLGCLIKSLLKKILNYLLDIIERELIVLGVCIAKNYAKERIEGYSRVLNTLNI